MDGNFTYQRFSDTNPSTLPDMSDVLNPVDGLDSNASLQRASPIGSPSGMPSSHITTTSFNSTFGLISQHPVNSHPGRNSGQLFTGSFGTFVDTSPSLGPFHHESDSTQHHWDYGFSMGQDEQLPIGTSDAQSLLNTFQNQDGWHDHEPFSAYTMTHIAPYAPQEALPNLPRSPSDICTVQPANDPHSFIFRCTFLHCYDKTYGRWSDFHRHYNGAHAPEKTIFFCPIADCNRSDQRGNRGFPRKDKMMTHVAKMHVDEVDEVDDEEIE